MTTQSIPQGDTRQALAREARAIRLAILSSAISAAKLDERWHDWHALQQTRINLLTSRAE